MFGNVKALSIPEGKVTKITDGSNRVLWSASRLPSIYQEVEWIKTGNNNATYIDLGIKFDIGARIEMGQYIYSNDAVQIFGSAENSGKVRCMITAPYTNKVALYGTGVNGFISSQKIDYKLNALNEYDITWKNGGMSVLNKTNNNYDINTQQIECTMSSNLYLFGQNYNGKARYEGIRQIHYFKYYDKNDELICDLVPCYRKSDGVIGMYDVVRKLFLTNVGVSTNKFIKGNDV